MNNPLISVIVPCYNHGQYLMECIDSIKKQTYPNFEIIVVNDGSTDEFTNNLINSISDSQINVINKKNAGLAAARNSGIVSCNGQIILPLDADDLIAPDYIKKAAELLVSNDQIGLVFCKGRYFGSEDGLMDTRYDSLKSELLYNGIFCSAFFRKADWEYIGKYNSNMKNGYEDWDFWLRLISYKNKVEQLPETMFFYRKNTGSMLDTLNSNIEAKKQMENTLFKNNIDIYLNEWGSMIGILREYEIFKNANTSINEAIEKVRDTFSYRLGNFILNPFKYISKLFKK